MKLYVCSTKCRAMCACIWWVYDATIEGINEKLKACACELRPVFTYCAVNIGTNPMATYTVLSNTL